MTQRFFQAYVSCSWGLADVGYVMIAHGVSNAIFSMLTGWLTKLTGRLLAVLIAFLFHLTIITALLVWPPDPLQQAVFFAISTLWGAADAIWVVQIICKLDFRFSRRQV
jgi:predicted MFS family arabinose efflux permease